MTDYFAALPAHIKMNKKARFNYIMEKIEALEASSSKTEENTSEGGSQI